MAPPLATVPPNAVHVRDSIGLVVGLVVLTCSVLLLFGAGYALVRLEPWWRVRKYAKRIDAATPLTAMVADMEYYADRDAIALDFLARDYTAYHQFRIQWTATQNRLVDLFVETQRQRMGWMAMPPEGGASSLQVTLLARLFHVYSVVCCMPLHMDIVPTIMAFIMPLRYMAAMHTCKIEAAVNAFFNKDARPCADAVQLLHEGRHPLFAIGSGGIR